MLLLSAGQSPREQPQRLRMRTIEYWVWKDTGFQSFFGFKIKSNVRECAHLPNLQKTKKKAKGCVCGGGGLLPFSQVNLSVEKLPSSIRWGLIS